MQCVCLELLTLHIRIYVCLFVNYNYYQYVYSVSRIINIAYTYICIQSADLWVVMFTNGVACSACSDAKPNFFRLRLCECYF